MVLSPKETFETSTADRSIDKTTSIIIKENGISKLFTPFAITEITTLYAWKNASDKCIYSVDEEVETSSILIYVPAATGLTETTGTFEDDKIGYNGSYYERYTEGDVDVSLQ